MLRPFSSLAVLSLLFISFQLTCAQRCTSPVSNCDPSVDYFPLKVTLEHSKTAKLNYKNTYADLRVTDAAGISHLHRLVRCGCEAPSGTPGNAQVISIPPARLYVDDSPSLAFITRSIAQTDRIVAVGNPDYVYSEAIRAKFKEPTPLTALANRSDVDVSFIYVDAVPGYKAANLTVPFFANGESDEHTPFGRAEWVKILAMMFDVVESGEINYNDIVSRYTNMKILASQAQRRPSVVLNFPYTFSGSTSWSQPSQNQYITEILRDANVDYLFMNDGNSLTNMLTLANITAQFKWARYLIHSGQYPPTTDTKMSSFFLDESQNATNNAFAVNEALRSLAAVRCANVWSRTKRISELGSNDYFEWGATRPDLLLKDIVHAVHPHADVSNETTFSFKIDDADAALKGGECPYNSLVDAAPEGMIYVDTEMSVKGLNRFEIENQLVEKIIPEVSKDERIPSTNIDAFFEKPQEADQTVLLLRTMVNEEESDDIVKEAETIVGSVQTALGDDADVTLMNVRKSEMNITITETKGGLSKGAIGGIIAGCLLFAIILGVILYYFGSKRSAKMTDQNLRDRFWKEHGVRLADDVSPDV